MGSKRRLRIETPEARARRLSEKAWRKDFLKRPLEEYEADPAKLYADYPGRIPVICHHIVRRGREKLCRKCLTWFPPHPERRRAICLPCLRVRANAWRARNLPERLQKEAAQRRKNAEVVRLGRRLVALGRPDEALELARKALCARREMTSDEERLAYLRGYMKGAEQREEVSSRLLEFEDIVFRVASDNVRKFGNISLSYEDCVSVGYQAVMHRVSRGNPTRASVAQAIRYAIVDAQRERSGRPSDKSHEARLLVNAARDHEDRNGVSILQERVGAEAQDRSEIDDILAQIDMKPRERAVCSYLARGFNLRETGEAIGVSESRICQTVREMRERYGEKLAQLLSPAE